MCKAHDSLKIFSYALSKLVKLHAGDSMSTKDALKTFSNTRIMKLLYCLCLESIGNNLNKAQNIHVDTINIQPNLFETFAPFVAYPNGPVQVIIYNAIDIIPGFIYKDGHMYEFSEDNSTIVNEVKKDFIKEATMIDESIQRLNQNMPRAIFEDRDQLISLTHKLPLWKESFMFSPQRIMSTSSKDLLYEYEAYHSIISSEN